METLTLDGIVLRPSALPIRPDWTKLFGRKAPLLLEIGVGNGEFLVWLAQRRPEANCVGVEMARDFLLKARNRVKAMGLTNVRLVPMEGSKALSRLFAPDSLTALYLNFPDPWHKKRHRERRLVNEAFAWLLASRLCLSGQFMMVTDYKPYAHQAVAAFSRCPAYVPLWEASMRSELPDHPATKYARKWAALGRQFFYIGFCKTQGVEPPEWVMRFYPLMGLRGDEPMPQVLLQVNEPINWWQLWQGLPKGMVWRDDEEAVNVKAVYLGTDSLVLDLVVAEGKLMQRFFAVIHAHPKGVRVGIHEAFHPDPTKGLHRAIALLGRVVLRLLPSSAVVQTTCLAAAWKETEQWAGG